VTFNVNFESLSSLIRVHLLVYELYSRQNARYNNKKNFKKSISITQTYVSTIYLFYSIATCFD